GLSALTTGGSDMSCKALLLVSCAVASIVAAGCKGYRTQGFKEPMKLGGKTIPASVLTEGERAYVLHCRACHGDKGDGKGPSSPRWKDEEPGEPIVPTPDPWQNGAAAVDRGRAVYHGVAQCLSCHPAFAPKRYIYEISKQLTGKGNTQFRTDMYGSELTKSEY